MNPNWSKISKFSGPEESPGFLLWQVSSLWRRKIEDTLRPLGLTHPQFVILANVSWLTRSHQLVSQKEIADHCKVDVATTSQILRTLERNNLIKRTFQKNNERNKYPKLTPTGKKLLEKALPQVESIDHAFFQQLDKQTLTLKKLLQELL